MSQEQGRRPGVTAAPRAGQTLLERYGLPPSDIVGRSLLLLEARIGDRLPAEHHARRVALMMLYAVGDPDLVEALRVPAAAVSAGVAALRGGCRVVVDVRMVAAAVDRPLLERLGCELTCAIDQPGAAELARQRGITRSAAAFELLAERLRGAVVAIGNAPTALLALLDAVDAGRATPALVVGTPVGLVAAAESKDELLRRAVPAISVRGTRGGSPLAAAALNALLRLAAEG
jgi:precorrin-8X/cobalt-precorrin-8 methylmutase